MGTPQGELMDFASGLSQSDIDPEVHDTLLSKIRDLTVPDASFNETTFQNTLCERVDAWRARPEYAEITLADWLLDAGIIVKPADAVAFK